MFYMVAYSLERIDVYYTRIIEYFMYTLLLFCLFVRVFNPNAPLPPPEYRPGPDSAWGGNGHGPRLLTPRRQRLQRP